MSKADEEYFEKAAQWMIGKKIIGVRYSAPDVYDHNGRSLNLGRKVLTIQVEDGNGGSEFIYPVTASIFPQAGCIVTTHIDSPVLPSMPA